MEDDMKLRNLTIAVFTLLLGVSTLPGHAVAMAIGVSPSIENPNTPNSGLQSASSEDKGKSDDGKSKTPEETKIEKDGDHY
jgi:hypothetical protein